MKYRCRNPSCRKVHSTGIVQAAKLTVVDVMTEDGLDQVIEAEPRTRSTPNDYPLTEREGGFRNTGKQYIQEEE